jgi:hypothetical protein
MVPLAAAVAAVAAVLAIPAIPVVMVLTVLTVLPVVLVVAQPMVVPVVQRPPIGLIKQEVLAR